MEDFFFKQKTLASDFNQPILEPVNIPDLIGPYKIDSFLKKGGMSELFLASDPESKLPLCIKVLPKHFTSNASLIKRFLKEAKIIQMTDHPNIIKLFGQGEDPLGLYIAMEFIQGLNLKQLLFQNSLSQQKSLSLVLNISYALMHLHGHGVVHRDLKPENILIDHKGIPKIIDFGIAQVNPNAFTQENLKIAGTPAYMSPEQKEDPSKASFQSDIYSLGVILYELILQKQCYGMIQLELIPERLRKILQKALQPDLKKRYLDIVDFVQDLSTYIHSGNIETLSSSDFEKHVKEELVSTKTQLCHLPPLDINLFEFAKTHLEGPYVYDFQILENGDLLLVQFGLKESISSYLHLSNILGAFKSKKYKTLQESVEHLDQFIKEQNIPSPIALFLQIHPQTDQLHFLSFGHVYLFHESREPGSANYISHRNPNLGELKSYNLPTKTFRFWKEDCLTWFLFSHLEDSMEQFLTQCLNDSHENASENRLFLLLDQIKIKSHNAFVLPFIATLLKKE
ncbi:MAG: Serine/threonine-protein kinase StkP [Chlamydiae bacterium]|nr:Serine/threonine-protein kinase StkP [Chlamydiota bacterium]